MAMPRVSVFDVNSEPLPNRTSCGIFLVNNPATHAGWMPLEEF
jgi:hypothetical protein